MMIVDCSAYGPGSNVKPKAKTGYYGCARPPGACVCPQDARATCAYSRWIERHADAPTSPQTPEGAT